MSEEDVTKDHTGSYASPLVMTLPDAVKSMIIDMTEESRAQVKLAVEQSLADQEAFMAYVIISFGNIREQLDTVLAALVHAEIITVEDNDDAPRA